MTGSLAALDEALGLALGLVVPLAGAGALGGLLGALGARWLGVEEPGLAWIARAAAVLVFLTFAVAEVSDRVVDHAAKTWSTLGAIGRGTP